MSQLTWYLVYSKPRQEAVAHYQLSRQGYESYLPVIHKEKIVKAKLKVVEESLFGRYLFVRTDAGTGKGLGPVRSTVGVSGLVMFNGQPQVVPDAIIEAIQARLAVNESQKLFESGEKVRIIDGPFQGWEAIYQTESADQRAMVLLDMLGKSNSLKFELHQLGKI